jgi:hypothetical protein
MEYTIAVLERVRARLAALPTPDRRSKQLNKQASIGFLAKELIASLRDGFTLDDLVGVLAEEGVSMTPVALKSHLRRVRPRARKRNATIRPSSKGTAPAQSSSDSNHTNGAQTGPVPGVPGATNGNPVERIGAASLPRPRPGTAAAGSFVPRKGSDKI